MWTPSLSISVSFRLFPYLMKALRWPQASHDVLSVLSLQPHLRRRPCPGPLGDFIPLPRAQFCSLHLLLCLTSQISAQHSHCVSESPKSHSRSGSSRYCLHDILAALVTISMWLLISVMMCCVSPPGPRSHSTETVPVTASCSAQQGAQHEGSTQSIAKMILILKIKSILDLDELWRSWKPHLVRDKAGTQTQHMDF